MELQGTTWAHRSSMEYCDLAQFMCRTAEIVRSSPVER
jgi:hypothetical protein